MPKQLRAPSKPSLVKLQKKKDKTLKYFKELRVINEPKIEKV